MAPERKEVHGEVLRSAEAAVPPPEQRRGRPRLRLLRRPLGGRTQHIRPGQERRRAGTALGLFIVDYFCLFNDN